MADIQVGDTVKIIESPQFWGMYSGWSYAGVSGFGLSPHQYTGRVGTVKEIGTHGSAYAILVMLDGHEIAISLDEIEKIDV